MKRNKNGQFKPKLNWTQLLFITIALGLLAKSFGLYLDNIKLQAENNYLQGYAKSIETKGLEHWNNWYLLNQNKYEQPRDIDGIIEFVFKKDAPIMKKIAVCESGLNPKAENKTSSATGIFQVLAQTHGISKRYLKHPLINALVAKELFNASGLAPWNASRHCWEVK